MDNRDQILLSVVIATLGGPTLPATIDSLMNSVIRPDEILISIPTKEAGAIKFLESDVVKVLSVKCRGQVVQRCEGFKHSKGKFVLQIDDDIILEKDCISKLLDGCSLKGNRSVCSPALYFMESRRSVYEKPLQSDLTLAMYYKILNGKAGYSEGDITMAGTEIGVDPSKQSDPVIETEWLPGGMVMHHRDNLILENFYPHSGKAYSEDLYHSVEMKNRGLHLYIVKDAIAWIGDPRVGNLPGLRSWLDNIRRDYNARKFLVKNTGRSLFRMNFFYLVSFLSYSYKRIKGI